MGAALRAAVHLPNSTHTARTEDETTTTKRDMVDVRFVLHCTEAAQLGTNASITTPWVLAKEGKQGFVVYFEKQWRPACPPHPFVFAPTLDANTTNRGTFRTRGTSIGSVESTKMIRKHFFKHDETARAGMMPVSHTTRARGVSTICMHSRSQTKLKFCFRFSFAE